jgi:predicted ester cyclase
MNADANKATIRRLWQTWEGNDIDAILAFWSPEAVNHGGQVAESARRPPPGREGLRRVLESLHTAFPDRTYAVDDLLAEGDRVVCRLTVRGTHQGTPVIPVEGGLLSTHPPTGRAYAVQQIHIFRLVDGLIAEHWAVRDDLGLMQQLGIVPTA